MTMMRRVSDEASRAAIDAPQLPQPHAAAGACGARAAGRADTSMGKSTLMSCVDDGSSAKPLAAGAYASLKR